MDPLLADGNGGVGTELLIVVVVVALLAIALAGRRP